MPHTYGAPWAAGCLRPLLMFCVSVLMLKLADGGEHDVISSDMSIYIIHLWNLDIDEYGCALNCWNAGVNAVLY